MDVDSKLQYLPDNLRRRLMQFQKDGIVYAIEKHGRCLIADEMGLGKTLQALSIAYYYKDEWPVLIVVPSSLKYPWIEEIEKWFPDIHPHDINLIQSGNDVGSIAISPISIVSYGLIRNNRSGLLVEALFQQKFKIVVLDESHYIKNRLSISAKILVPLVQRAIRRLLITGTPALSRPAELFAQLDALCYGDFISWGAFAQRYCDAKYEHFGRVRKWNTSGASNLDELQTKLRNIMIRRLKDNVLTQLPPKQRQKISFDIKESQYRKNVEQSWTDLTGIIKRLKLSVIDFFRATDDGITVGNSFFEMKQLVLKLYRQTCLAKIGPVVEYVKMLVENDSQKILIFAYHHDMMDAIQRQLWDSKVNFIRIDGNTPQIVRPDLVHSFQNDPDVKVAILSILAAGVGLTFTAASLVVFAELYWTPGVLVQCEDRAHRIGQQSTVNIQYLVAHSTVDEWVWSAVSKKNIIITTTLNGQVQELKARESKDIGQIAKLSNADVYEPPTDNTATAFFSDDPNAVADKLTQITDFFGGRTKKKNLRKTPPLITIDSDSDDVEDFKPQEKRKRLKRKVDDIKSYGINCKEDDLPEIIRKPQIRNYKRKADTMKTTTKTSAKICAIVEAGKDDHIPQQIDSEDDDELIGAVQYWESQTSFENMASQDSRNSNNEKWTSAPLNESNSPSLLERSSLTNSNSFVSRNDSFDSRYSLSQPLPVSLIESTSDDEQLVGALDKCEESGSPRANLRSSGVNAGNENNESAISFTVSGNICDLENNAAYDGIESLDDRNSQVQTLHLCPNGDVPDEKDDLESCGSESLFSDDESLAGMDDIDILDISSEEEPEIRLSPEALADLDDITVITSDEDESLSSTEMVKISEENEITVIADSNDETFVESPLVMKGESTIQDIGIHEKEIKEIKNNLHQDTVNNDMTISEENDNSKPSETLEKTSFVNVTDNQQMANVQGGDFITARELHESIGHLESSDPKGPDNENENDSNTADDKSRSIDLDEMTVYSQFLYCTSKNTSRVYLFDLDGTPLNASFLPLDVETENFTDLPDLLIHPQHLQLVKVFCAEWNSLTLTKRRVVSNGGQLFTSPIRCYEDVRRKPVSKQRYTTKLDVAFNAVAAAQESGGTVRIINRPKQDKAKQSLETRLKELCKAYPVPDEVKALKTPKKRACHVTPKKRPLKPGFKGSGSSATKRNGKSYTALRKAAFLEQGEMSNHECRSLSSTFATISTPEKSHVSVDQCNMSPIQQDSKRPRKSIEPDEITAEPGVAFYQGDLGYVQAVDKTGVPLCINCQKPNEAIQINNNPEEYAWHTRFCSKQCSEQHWVKTSREYGRKIIYEVEQGICQICKFNAEQFFTQIKVTKDLERRAQLIKDSPYNILKPEVKDRMVTKPYRGQFWHVDHIKAVMDGGGQCDIDNLRTLCVLCHQKVTSSQKRQQAINRRKQHTQKYADLTKFFKPSQGTKNSEIIRGHYEINGKNLISKEYLLIKLKNKSTSVFTMSRMVLNNALKMRHLVKRVNANGLNSLASSTAHQTGPVAGTYCLSCNLLQGQMFHTSPTALAKKKTKKKPINVRIKSKKAIGEVLSITPKMTVQEVANLLDKDTDHVFDCLFHIPGGDYYDEPNMVIEEIEVIQEILKKTGYRYKIEHDSENKPKKDKDVYRQPPAEESALVKRPPVVTIMGHVDHGKTTLLDTLRHSHIVSQEFGGITQHIGAFSVKLSTGDTITFLDTPGHAAFSAMRERGAHITDIVVLVVAADDGVMEQTRQSIKFAQDAGVPIIVAINKMDRGEADIEKTKSSLLQEGIQLEDQGGDVMAVPISALKGTGLMELQEAIVTLAELSDFRSDPTGNVEAQVIESKTDLGRGKLATALIRRGTLKKGTCLVAGTAWAKVRGMFNEFGKPIREVPPGCPVEIIGWRDLPHAGDEILQVESERKAHAVVDYRLSNIREQKAAEEQVIIDKKRREHRQIYEEELKQRHLMGFIRTQPKQKQKEEIETRTGPALNIVIKGDVAGSVEAILDTLDTYQSEQCHLDIIHYGVGSISETDINLAKSFDGLVYGFNVKVSDVIKKFAEENGVKILLHNVIYRLVDDLRVQLTARLPPVQIEEKVGEANVLELFNIKDGRKRIQVAGCRCVKGYLNKKSHAVRIFREQDLIYDGAIESLKHFKNEVETIKTGVECGMNFRDLDVQLKNGDKVICYMNVEKPQTIQWNTGF
ncbi:uncharacterized protein LOC141900831 [Tubulanus polymorphus]|uniref:uncharacterized protein LOC141900831 n=1 Tax=Tubulanus polymorphus TaxID=672921 RepID=UPI003DA51D64